MQLRYTAIILRKSNTTKVLRASCLIQKKYKRDLDEKPSSSIRHYFRRDKNVMLDVALDSQTQHHGGDIMGWSYLYMML